MTSGVGFTMTDGHTGYFWTWSRAEEVLAAFRARGVTIDPQPRGARALWRALRTSTTVATESSRSRARAALPWLAPVGAVAATVIMIVFVTNPDLPLAPPWCRIFEYHRAVIDFSSGFAVGS